MKRSFSCALILAAFFVQAQNKAVHSKALTGDSTQLHKIIPGEIPQPILDSLQKMNFTIADVYTAHRNGRQTVYVIEIAHDLVRDVFWFDPRGRKLRPKAEKGIN